MKRQPKDDIAKQLANAQMTLVEKALIGWLEETLGRVPTDKELLAKGVWAYFDSTPLTVFEKDGWKFNRFYVYDRTYVLALGFPDPEDLLCLKFVELRKSDWPTALRLFLAQKEDGA